MRPVVLWANSVESIDSRIRGMCRDGLNPTLAIAFCAFKNNVADLQTVLASHHITLFGTTSSSVFTHEGSSEAAIAVMLLDVPQDAFQVRLFDGRSNSTAQSGRMVASWVKDSYEDPALLIISAGLHYNGEQIINHIQDTLQSPHPLFGGFSGFQTGPDQPQVFTTSQILENGIMALAFDRNAVDLYGIAASGWKGVGTPKTITRAEGNIIYDIDGAPALDMYNKYLNIGTDPTLAYEYPLLLLRDDGSSVLRGSVTVNDDKSITYGGAVPQGAKVRFSIPPGLEITDRALDIVTGLHRQVPYADAIVLFSCKGRQFTLGPMVEDEISAIHQLWKAPLIGFFTDGEIGPMPSGRCELHNHTLVPVVIRQKGTTS